jgi:hypothetical protein
MGSSSPGDKMRGGARSDNVVIGDHRRAGVHVFAGGPSRRSEACGCPCGRRAGYLVPVDDARTLLRHTLATLAYRAGKTLRGAPPAFAEFRAASGTRSAGETLAHMGDLLDWGLHLAQGHHVWRDSPPRAWEEEVARFFAALRAFDDFLATEERLGFLPGRLFQGPVADALWHTGQLALLRRLAGVPIRGENYFKADIAPGRVGPEQSPPVREFD